nr:uncharacterized protein LOC122321051 [Drosophila bipectinata]
MASGQEDCIDLQGDFDNDDEYFQNLFPSDFPPQPSNSSGKAKEQTEQPVVVKSETVPQTFSSNKYVKQKGPISKTNNNTNGGVATGVDSSVGPAVTSPENLPSNSAGNPHEVREPPVVEKPSGRSQSHSVLVDASKASDSGNAKGAGPSKVPKNITFNSRATGKKRMANKENIATSFRDECSMSSAENIKSWIRNSQYDPKKIAQPVTSNKRAPEVSVRVRPQKTISSPNAAMTSTSDQAVRPNAASKAPFSSPNSPLGTAKDLTTDQAQIWQLPDMSVPPPTTDQVQLWQLPDMSVPPPMTGQAQLWQLPDMSVPPPPISDPQMQRILNPVVTAKRSNIGNGNGYVNKQANHLSTGGVPRVVKPPPTGSNMGPTQHGSGGRAAQANPPKNYSPALEIHPRISRGMVGRQKTVPLEYDIPPHKISKVSQETNGASSSNGASSYASTSSQANRPSNSNRVSANHPRTSRGVARRQEAGPSSANVQPPQSSTPMYSEDCDPTIQRNVALFLKACPRHQPHMLF